MSKNNNEDTKKDTECTDEPGGRGGLSAAFADYMGLCDLVSAGKIFAAHIRCLYGTQRSGGGLYYQPAQQSFRQAGLGGADSDFPAVWRIALYRCGRQTAAEKDAPGFDQGRRADKAL